MNLFVDTWAFLGLLDKKDQDHEIARKAVTRAVADSVELVTTDYVLAETITLLSRRLPGQIAKTMPQLFRFHKEACIFTQRISSSRFSDAAQLRILYADKPSISFVDLTSMVVMKDMHIEGIITRDRDFLAVNMGFELFPSF